MTPPQNWSRRKIIIQSRVATQPVPHRAAITKAHPPEPTERLAAGGERRTAGLAGLSGLQLWSPGQQVRRIGWEVERIVVRVLRRLASAATANTVHTDKAGRAAAPAGQRSTDTDSQSPKVYPDVFWLGHYNFFPVPLWQLFEQAGGRLSQPVWFQLVTKLTHDTVVSIIRSVRAHCPWVLHHLHVSSYPRLRTPPSARVLVPTYPSPHVPTCQNPTLFTYPTLCISQWTGGRNRSQGSRNWRSDGF